MIHGNSNDPVNVKKIALKIWTLRDEIRDTIRKQLGENDGKVGDIQSIINEYKEAKEGAPPTQQIKKESELDDSEDAMAAALADGDNEEEAKEDSSKEESSDQEDGETVKASDNNNSDSKEAATVIQRRPELEENQLYHAKTLLAEIAMDRMFFFCSETFTEGTSVVVEFCVPQRFVINAEVIYCRLYNMKSRIISKNKLPYRIAVDFNFLKEGERTLLRQFLKTIEPEVYEHLDSSKLNPTDDDDDEFSELDDL